MVQFELPEALPSWPPRKEFVGLVVSRPLVEFRERGGADRSGGGAKEDEIVDKVRARRGAPERRSASSIC
ncbi:hypothetical protein U1Q18_038383 [Sarracenia purpurea var. burkii]